MLSVQRNGNSNTFMCLRAHFSNMRCFAGILSPNSAQRSNGAKKFACRMLSCRNDTDARAVGTHTHIRRICGCIDRAREEWPIRTELIARVYEFRFCVDIFTLHNICAAVCIDVLGRHFASLR